MKLSLRARLTAVLVVLAIAPLAVVTWLGLSYFLRDKESFIFELNGRAAATAAGEVGRAAAALEASLRSIAIAASDPGIPEERRAALARDLFREGRLLAVAVGEGTKTELFLRDDAALGALAAKITAADLLRPGAPPLANGTPDARMPAVVVRVSIPVKGGPALTAAALARAADLFDARGYSDPYQAFLVDSTGKVLVHPDAATMARHDDWSELPIVAAARDQRTGSRRYQDDEDGRKVEKIGAYATVEVAKRPVGEVIITLPAAAAGDAVRRLVRYALGAVAGVLVMALIVAFLFAGNLGRKVEHLTAAASAVAAGRYDAPLPVEGGDEIGELARAFDAMQKGLADREARLKEATEQLAQSEKMGALGQLAAGISHEIKNPMAGIIGFAQLGLKRVPPDSPIAEDFRIIEREGKRSLEILQNLLRFARREEMALEPVDPNTVVEESLTISGHQLKLLKIRVEKRLDPKVPKVNGNLGQLQQVLMNFILNAAQAMQPKGGVLTITTGCAPDGRVVLEVKDEGSGISEENKKKLFTPFFSTKPKSEGTGLGLSVSYGIIRSHGGEIKVWSEQGVGSIFYIYLPALPA